MRASFFQLARHPHIIFEIVFRAGAVEDIAGVTNGTFTDAVRLIHRVHRNPHVLNPVEGIEHPEQINAALRRLRHKALHHIVRIGSVANPIGAAQQHLDQMVRHGSAQVAQALPRAFLQKAVGNVKGGATPAFHRKKLRQVAGIGGGHAQHIDRAHAGGEQALMAVPHGGVSHQQHASRSSSNRQRPLVPAPAASGASPFAAAAFATGGFGTRACSEGLGRPRVSGWPFTVMSAI